MIFGGFTMNDTRMFPLLFVVLTYGLTGCGDEITDGQTTCQQAAQHLAACFEEEVQASEKCDPADFQEANNILKLSCSELTAAVAMSKADFDQFSPALNPHHPIWSTNNNSSKKKKNKLCKIEKSFSKKIRISSCRKTGDNTYTASFRDVYFFERIECNNVSSGKWKCKDKDYIEQFSDKASCESYSEDWFLWIVDTCEWYENNYRIYEKCQPCR